jgi:phosphoribosylanthranilate isomerase
MALKTLVKVGGITNLSDARYCAGMGADFLGFRVTQGFQNSISIKTYQEIRGWVTGPQIVAEIYGLSDAAQLREIIENFRPDVFELGMKEYESIGSHLEIPFILALKEGDDVPHLGVKPAYVLVDDGPTVSKFIPQHEVLVSVRNRDEAERCLKHTGVSGLALEGGQEVRPGLKSYDDLADILELLEQD